MHIYHPLHVDLKNFPFSLNPGPSHPSVCPWQEWMQAIKKQALVRLGGELPRENRFAEVSLNSFAKAGEDCNIVFIVTL